MTKKILIIFLIWAVWIGYQYQAKSQAASALVQQRVNEFYATDINTIYAELGQGYAYKTEEVDGQQYWIRWQYRKKGGNLIEMEGKVDFIELFPFSDLRLGHSFSPVLKVQN